MSTRAVHHMSTGCFSTAGEIGAKTLAEAFPITAYFGALRIDFESPEAACRWLAEQLTHIPEQDHYGWFTKEESPFDLGAFDSLHLLHPRTAHLCRHCGNTRAAVEDIAHGPLCCPCSDDLGREEFLNNQQTKPTR